MRSTTIAITLVVAAALVTGASCAENEQTASPPPDAAVGDSQNIDDGSKPDDDGGGSEPVPPSCVGEWCSLVVDGMRDVALNAVSGSAPDNVWIVGTKGFVARFNGTAWEDHRIDTLLPLYAVWTSGPTDVWVANTGKTLFHWNGTTWEESTLEGADEDSRAVLALVGSGPENVLALTESSYAFGTECPLSWGTTNIGCPKIYRRSRLEGELSWRVASDPTYTCENLVEDLSCATLNALWLDPSGEPWAVGAGGRAVRPRGAAPPPTIRGGLDETHAIATLQGISGSSSDDAWAVGATGTIRHFTGGSWKAVTSPTSAHLRAVWTRSASEAWAVGDQGAILRWDGTSWQLVPSPLDERPRDLRSVWGASNGDVWTVGARVLMRRQPQPVSQP